MAPYILGISAGNHDAAAALLAGGEILAALEEEKLARVRRARGLPVRAISHCLNAAGLKPGQVEYVALARPLRGDSTGSLQGEWGIPRRLKEQFPASRMVVLDHHLCHAAAAYYPSPFDQAGVLTLDESGDLRTASLSLGRGSELSPPLEDSYFPDSLGNLYSHAAALAGFTAGGDEHKLQWLSAWGRPRYTQVLGRLLCVDGGGRLNLDQSYFYASRDHVRGFSERFFEETGLPPKEPLTAQQRADLAASVQQALETGVLRMAEMLRSRTGTSAICLGGGVALNALLVERLETCGTFEAVFAQPAAGNAGNAVGAALYCAHSLLGLQKRFELKHLFYGPEYDDDDVKNVLENCKLRFRYMPRREPMLAAVVDALRKDQIVGWFQGRTEFGPRALGARSILASPVGRYVNENLNQFVKHRERFRPFAASVVEEHAGEFFEFQPMARFLATVGRVKPQHRQTFAANLFPGREAQEAAPEPASEADDLAAEAFDGSRVPAEGARIRVHVVERKTNPLFWELLESFGRATGVPVLFNTSFNLFGEPLVCSPRDAVRSFYCSGIDQLFIGRFSVTK